MVITTTRMMMMLTRKVPDTSDAILTQFR
jgi:hypothetical protein